MANFCWRSVNHSANAGRSNRIGPVAAPGSRLAEARVIEEEAPAGFHEVMGVDGEHYTWLTGTHVVRSFDNGKTWGPSIEVQSPLGAACAVSDPVIELPGGIEVVSIITKHSAEALTLAKGKEVYAVIKASNVMIATD